MGNEKDFCELLQRCRERDKDAWEVFIKLYGHIIYRYIIKTMNRYFYTYNEDDLDDIFNNVFLALLSENCKKLKEFRGCNERSFLAYLRVMIFHIAVDYLRERKNFIELDRIQDLDLDYGNPERMDRRDLNEVILILREGLPSRYNLLFRLIYEEGFNFSEVADIMNMKTNAVHQLKYRMVCKIRQIAQKKNLYADLQFMIGCIPCLLRYS